MRTLSAEYKAAIAEPLVFPFWLIFLDFLNPEGAAAPIRLSTISTGVTWDSYTWSGHMVGLLGISSIVETTDGASETVTITLDGIDSGVMAGITTTQYQHRTAEIYLGLRDTSTKAVIVDPFLTFSGTMDSDNITDDGTIATLEIEIVSQLTRQLKPSGIMYTHNDQQRLWPDGNDSGLEFLAEMQGVQVKWGPQQ
jgi:hypothetical protein